MRRRRADFLVHPPKPKPGPPQPKPGPKPKPTPSPSPGPSKPKPGPPPADRSLRKVLGKAQDQMTKKKKIKIKI